MKRIFLLLIILTFASANNAKPKNQALWPDGTMMDAFFSNTTKVDVKKLGKQYVITDYGVKRDSTLVQTETIQAVIDLCASEGGGVIVIPEGTFLSGSLFFKQGTNLYVKGRIKGSDRIRDFKLLETRMEGQTLQYFAALINADGLDGFCITGDGAKLDWDETPNELSFTLKQSCIDGNGFIYWEEFWLRRMYNKACTNLEAMRPRLVYLSNCKNVTVQDINLINSPFWTNHLYRCEYVRYLDNFIYAPTKGVVPPSDTKQHGAPSSDAIDLDVCHDILVSGCYMQVNDDAVVIKGGKGTWADKDPNNGPVYNVLVKNCRYGKAHGCLTLGSESIHDWNIVLSDIKIKGVNRVLWLKMRPDTPQHYEKIRVENVKGSCNSFLVVRPWTQFFQLGDRPDMPLSLCNDITFRDIDVDTQNFFDVGISDKYKLQNFTFENCNVRDKKQSFDPTMIEGCQTKNLFINGEEKGPSAKTISLKGEWRFRSEREEGTVKLPGSMLTNGKGDPINVDTKWTCSLYDSSYFFNPYMEKYRIEGQMKFPFFLTPERHYVGRAWYERTIQVPEAWKGRQVTLFLERPHIETTVKVNGHEVGHQMSLSTPHQFDLTPYIKYGGENELSIEVYNGIENVSVGQDSHSVTDQTQGNWNGIIGRMELQARPIIWRKRVIPHLEDQTIDILINDSTYHLDLGTDTLLWDEFHPQLYTRIVDYQGKPVSVTFGLREIKAKGQQLFINNRPLFLRGTVENCTFPETGYPPTDEADWERVFGKCKEYGLNHIRFHSYCPPEAAFSVADRLGLYLQPEGPSWPSHGVRLKRGMPIDQYLLDESLRIIDTYGHHPSFCMMAAGNEPAGDWLPYCQNWLKTMKEYDPNRIYCAACVGGGWVWDEGSDYHVKSGARGLAWDSVPPQSKDDFYELLRYPINYRKAEPNNEPVIAHEVGQWCAFPDFKEIPQYTGVYKARNFEIFQDLLRDNGMASLAEKFLMASGHLQVLCYKYDIERNLRTKDYSGFQLLGLNDYSGQGTALVGPLNVHWREKGYCTKEDWTEFCSPIVPLAKFPKFVYTNDEILQVPIEVYNASERAFENVKAIWSIAEISGTMPMTTIPIGKNTELGMVSLPLSQFDKPTKLTLTVQLSDKIKNHWDFWVYPKDLTQTSNLKPQTSFYETDTLDAKALKVLKKGGDVLLTAGSKVRYGDDVVHSFLPVFWNTSWFKMRPPHTTGAYIQSEHPVFRDFPTDDWQNLNWWELVSHTPVINMKEFPADFQPIVQPIDTWHVSRKLGMLLEVRVLNGRLLMTTMDISTNLESRPVARQLRYSIMNYMASKDFQPSTKVEPEVIRHLFEREAPPVNVFTTDAPDELKFKMKSN